MKTDIIIELKIDNQKRLTIKPLKESFEFIYRSVSDVHWDNKNKILYNSELKEASYLDWYKQIVDAVASEYCCRLVLSNNTIWKNIPDDLKNDIINFNDIFNPL